MPHIEPLIGPAGPVRRHTALRAGSRLVGRVGVRRRELRPVVVGVVRVRPEPVLARLEALDDRVAGLGGMLARMLARRGVAAPDVAARRAAAQVEPPALLGREALYAARAARRNARVDLPGHARKLTRTRASR